MKTGLGLFNKYRKFIAYINLHRFNFRKHMLGFDVANIFITKIDKISLQLILTKNGATLGNDCDIETGQTFHNCKDYSNLIIGNNCHIGKNCFFDLRGKVIIDDNVVISMHCKFITHIDLSKSELRKKYPSSFGDIKIEHDSYIGASSMILMNTLLKNNCFIAAGSVVTKAVDSYNMVGGIPASFLKMLQ